MNPIILVTGTDTGVGKTVVTCAIIRALRSRGECPFPIKPVETGCSDIDRPDDALALRDAAGALYPLEAICPVRYRTPAAPTTAARLEGSAHSFATLVAHIKRVADEHPRLIVEGAGGLLVPLAPGKTYADLALALGAPLIVVARDALGTINHTSLTLEAARSRGIPVLAVILNAVAAPDAVRVDHAFELRALWPGVPILGPTSRMKNPQSTMMSNEISIQNLIGLIDDITLDN